MSEVNSLTWRYLDLVSFIKIYFICIHISGGVKREMSLCMLWKHMRALKCFAALIFAKALDGGKWLESCLSHFTDRKRALCTHWIGSLGSPQNCSGHFEGEKSFVGLSVFMIMSRRVAQEWWNCKLDIKKKKKDWFYFSEMYKCLHEIFH